MSTKHTPKLRLTDGGIIDNDPPPGHAGIEIADVYGADMSGADDRGPGYEEAMANGRLFVAAPVLLEACKLAYDANKYAPGCGKSGTFATKTDDCLAAAIARAGSEAAA